MSEELPHGWTTAELQDVCSKVQDGTHFSPKNQTRNGDFKYITAKNIKVRGIDLSDVTYISKDVHRQIYKRCNPGKGDVLYIKDGATTGIATVNDLEEEFSLLSSVALLKPNKDALNAHYLKWYLNSPAGFRAMTGQMTGSAITRLVLRTIRKSSIPLAPFDEQRRIIAKLEKLLGRVDSCQQRLTKIPLLLKRFRQSILAAACSGRLTAAWRKKLGLSGGEWRRTTVKDATSKIEYGYTASARTGTGPRFLRITDIQDGRVAWDEVPTCDIKPASSKKYALKPGDIVFARTGATTGKSFLIRKCPPAVFASYLIRVQSGAEVLPEFLYLFFQTPEYWIAISENVAGNAQPNCNATKLGQLEFQLPPVAEQKEIVRRVDELFALADQIETRYAKAKSFVDNLAQSILAKAFRGELVPQDPNDEPASVLLDRIRQQQNAEADRPRKSRRSVRHSRRAGAVSL